MDEGGGFVVMLFLGGIILAIFVAYFAAQVLAALIVWVYENREEIKACLIYTAQLLWRAWLLPHQVAAAGVLYVGRDLVVKYWPARYGAEQERWAVISWVAVVPIVLSMVWCGMASWCFGLVMPSAPLALMFGVASTSVVTVCYYRRYFGHHPSHHNWPIFLAREQNMRFDALLAYIEYRTRVRMWWHAVRS